MKLVSIFGGHDSSITFCDTEKEEIHIIEFERLVRKRYFRLHVDNDLEAIKAILCDCRDIAKKFWNFSDPDRIIITADGHVDVSVLTQVFQTSTITMVQNHHECHASCAFYLSPYDEALIFSFDGGGNDGYFNVYHAKDNKIELLQKVQSDLGGGHMLGASILHEISDNSRHQLALSGKAMGLCAYGKPNEDFVPHFKSFLFDRDYKKLSKATDLELLNLDSPWKSPMDNAKFSGQEAYDLAATLQRGFEEAFIDVFVPWQNKFPSLNVCFSGGCSLNVLLNERIKNEFGVELFVPPNPHDGGLSLGSIFLVSPPVKRPVITYNGIPLLDKDELPKYIEARGARKITITEIAKLIKDGSIVGLVHGDSEVGPRALGNRSIVCDPAFNQMKDSLNSKVKFREWYRPFAPFCKEEDAPIYFNSANYKNLQYMSFAPSVKEEFVEILPAITHVDGTSRLQTVTEDEHQIFYELLTEFGKLSDTRVLLNTSFNIRGQPILTTIKDALHVLDTTDLDYVVVEGFLFTKTPAKS